MGFFELVFLALGLSMDAFAVAVCFGLTMRRRDIKKALVVGAYFGAFQAGMPMIGFFTASIFADRVTAYSHWVTFVLLVILGVKMARESLKGGCCKDRKCPAIDTCKDRSCPVGGKGNIEEVSLAPLKIIPLAIATSIDALAVGVFLAFMQVSLAPAVGLIGLITFAMSAMGVMLGRVLGARFRNKAQLVGGLILMLMGVYVLIEHFGIV